MRCTQINPEFQQLIEWDAPSLTTYAIEARYDLMVFPTVEEAKRAVSLAEQVRDFVRGKLKEEGFGGQP